MLLEEPDKAREILILHDTAGVTNFGPVELKKAYVQAADAFVLVYSSADYESFNRVDLLKKWIDRQFGKDKKEVSEARAMLDKPKSAAGSDRRACEHARPTGNGGQRVRT